MDATVWIAGVTGLAGVAKAWVDLRKSGTDLEKAKAELAKAMATADNGKVTSTAEALAPSLVIAPELLEAFVQDILAARQRFLGCINDQRYSPADIDREEQRARLCICTHLKKIREFNAGELPTPELSGLARSFRCDA